ncbi:acetate kinase [Cupriavidus sp. BIS7]|uniref:acetate kinase n=1 Tax=Cupriavidus sp. BIS7 TaxID=1217718 RepID=UPI0002DE95BB|nr:acetate kinase [Cupriavidus sp. BIS7]
MKKRSLRGIRCASCSTMLLLGGLAHAQTTPDDAPPTAAQFESLQKEIAERAKQLETMKRVLTERADMIRALRSTVDNEMLSHKRGGQAVGNGVTPGNGSPDPAASGSASNSAQINKTVQQGAQDQQTPSDMPPQAVAPQGVQQVQAGQGEQQGESAPDSGQPVGTPPERDTRPPAIAPIFDQPGVLTPQGKIVVEPSFQYSYSYGDTVSLVGYTVIPAVLIGLIDIRDIRTSTYVSAFAFRYGITKRLEIEAKVPYVSASSNTVSHEVFTGTAVDSAFTANGSGLGDVEATLRYQLNYGNEKMPYFIGWLRYKSNTGRDPFQVVTDCVTRCVGNTTGTGLPLSMPTGTGFQAIQPGITWLFQTDPAVLFGGFSYLHNFARDDVYRNVLAGQQESLGKIAPGDMFEFNFGLGVALNEHGSFSIGYDQSIIWPTKQNGETIAGSVRITQGTLLVGYSYRFNNRYTLNLSVGAGLTRDTPDLTVTVRLPITF